MINNVDTVFDDFLRRLFRTTPTDVRGQIWIDNISKPVVFKPNTDNGEPALRVFLLDLSEEILTIRDKTVGFNPFELFFQYEKRTIFIRRVLSSVNGSEQEVLELCAVFFDDDDLKSESASLILRGSENSTWSIDKNHLSVFSNGVELCYGSCVDEAFPAPIILSIFCKCIFTHHQDKCCTELKGFLL